MTRKLDETGKLYEVNIHDGLKGRGECAGVETTVEGSVSEVLET